MQTADGNYKVTSQLTIVLYILKLVLYFNSIIISNQFKYCLAINRGNFLQIQRDIQTCFADSLSVISWSAVETARTKNSRKLMPGT